MGKKSDKHKDEPAKARKSDKKAEAKAAKTPKKVATSTETPVVKPKATPAAVAKPQAPAKPKPKKAVTPPTFEEIQLQAYFVAEKRRAAGLPGDSASDWIQAEQELLAARAS